jgi:hypothetical protein
LVSTPPFSFGATLGAPSGLVNLAHLPQKTLGEVGVEQGSRRFE